jgi:hypothetical protein
MIPVNGGNHSASPPTAVFFNEQTAAALIQAVREFEECEFSRDSLIRHAERWSVPEFQRRMRMAVMAFVNGSASFR